MRTWRSENFFSSSRVRLRVEVLVRFLRGMCRLGEEHTVAGLCGSRGGGERERR